MLLCLNDVISIFLFSKFTLVSEALCYKPEGHGSIPDIVIGFFN
jgi:hypothetical protein